MLLLSVLRERADEPFMPFAIHLANGTRLAVVEKEFCHVEREIVTVVEAGAQILEWTIDPNHIVALEQLQPPLSTDGG